MFTEDELKIADDQWTYIKSGMLAFVGLVAFALGLLAAAGHSRMIYDTGRVCGLLIAVALVLMSCLSRKNVRFSLLFRLPVAAFFVWIFVCVTYPGIAFYDVSGVEEWWWMFQDHH